MNSYLRSRQTTLKILVLALVVTLMLAACERPLQNVTDGEDATPTVVVAPTEPAVQDEAPTVSPTEPAEPEEATVTPPEEAQATATPVAEDESPRTDEEDEEGPAEEEDATDEETSGEATSEPTTEPTAEPEDEATPEPTAAPTDEPAGSAEERIHTVQAGDNLYRIGLQYGISWTVLAEYNDIANPNSLVAGQQIRIPPTAGGEDGAGATPTPEVTHVVQQGETLFIISQQYGVVWTDIAAANNLVAPYTIHAGQTLVIPGGQ